jgi:hypothetical protein
VASLDGERRIGGPAVPRQRLGESHGDGDVDGED